MGLRQQIANAKSQSELVNLLEAGLLQYEFASKRTILSWKHTARRRQKELIDLSSTSENKPEKKPVSKTSKQNTTKHKNKKR
jgi:hypothetical protein